MKTKKWLIILVLSVLSACGSADVGGFTPTKIDQKYHFMAFRAHPTDRFAVDRAVPNVNTTRLYQLDTGHYLKINADSLKVDLPYFGRAYRHQYGAKNSGFQLGTDKFSVEKRENKGKTIYKITPKEENIQNIILEVYADNKAASVHIYSNDRQSISYDGELRIED